MLTVSDGGTGAPLTPSAFPSQRAGITVAAAGCRRRSETGPSESLSRVGGAAHAWTLLCMPGARADSVTLPGPALRAGPFGPRSAAHRADSRRHLDARAGTGAGRRRCGHRGMPLRRSGDAR